MTLIADHKQRLKLAQRGVRTLAKRAGKGEQLSPAERLKLKQLDGEAKRIETIINAENDVALFAYEYFSDERNLDNAAGNFITNGEDGEPHESIEEMAPIHRDMYNISDEITTKVKGKYAICCPRGHAKTTVLSTILALHEIVYQKRKYILLLSETDTLSKRILTAISTQLKHNAKLRRDFGELLNPISTKNEVDNENNFITSAKQLVEASSSGKALRGKTHLGNRPDLIIADDLSSMNNEATEQQREKLIDWWNTTITPLGSRNCATVIVGTKVTATGLLATLLTKREYKSVTYSAIINGPDNPDLWSDYLHLYNSDAPQADVDAFYNEHQAEMESGIELSWPRRWTYRALMHEKATIGSRAFASEYLNESFAEDEQFFKMDRYGYCRRVFDNSMYADAVHYNGKYYYLNDMVLTLAYDPALGESKRADLNAYVLIGKHKESGYYFILDTFAKRCAPSEFMEAIINKALERRIHNIALEGIGAYRLLEDELRDRLKHARLYSTRLSTIKSHGKQSKQARIESLEVPLENKTIILNEHETELLSEMRYYPMPGNKVDVIDALSMAYETATKKAPIKIIPKPDWLY